MVTTPLLSALKWLGAAAAMIVVAVAAGIAIVGWDWVRPFVTNRISDALGRELSIGDIDLVDLSLAPRIRFESVWLDNAVWDDKPYMLKVRELAFNIDLRELIRGRTVLSNVAVQQPWLYLATSSTGTPNWAFLTERTSGGKAAIPIVEHWRISRGHVTYHNIRSGSLVKGTVARAQGRIVGAERRVSLHGDGQLEGKPWALSADLGSLLEPGRPRPNEIHARITFGGTRAKIDGSIVQPLKLNGLAVDFVLEGPDPARLRQVAPVTLPHLPPYRVEGQLKREGNSWALEDLTSSVGLSDVAGDVTVITGGERTRLRANLVSDKLDFVQIFGPAEPIGTGRVIPDTTIDVSPLREIDAQVFYEATRIYMPGATFARISTELSLADGHLTLEPLKFDYLGGTFDGAIEVAANEKPVQTSLNVKLQKLSLNEILALAGVADQATGVISGAIGLTGQGRSPADFAASAGGGVWLVMQDGRINELLIEKAGLGLIESLSLIDDKETDSVSTCTVEGPWCAEDSEDDEQRERAQQNEKKAPDTVRVRCLIADFKARDGLMTTRTLIVETAETKVVGHGTIALSTELVDLELLPLAKDFSLLAGQAPLHVQGSFRDLEVNVSKARIALSLLTPMELGTADPADCKQLTQAVRQQQLSNPR